MVSPISLEIVIVSNDNYGNVVLNDSPGNAAGSKRDHRPKVFKSENRRKVQFKLPSTWELGTNLGLGNKLYLSKKGARGFAPALLLFV